ncbi:hypothetical protein Bbelb_361650 [Branchiostoma belcheri]|nr:hypothetical protein Bbelb_361650 [Branchiostoma belcheri]
MRKINMTSPHSEIKNHVIYLDVRDVADADTGNQISFRIFSSNRWTDWFEIPGSFSRGTTKTADIGPAFFGNFGTPDKIELKTSGTDWLALNEIRLYNGYTHETTHFRCNCELSTDSGDSANAVQSKIIERYNEIKNHVIYLDVRDVADADTGNQISFRIFSSNRWTDWFEIPGSFSRGTTKTADIGPAFFGNFGTPDKIELKTSGTDWLALNEIRLYNGYTHETTHFRCNCELSTDSGDSANAVQSKIIERYNVFRKKAILKHGCVAVKAGVWKDDFICAVRPVI